MYYCFQEFPWHFIEDQAMFAELEEFVVGLEDYGPIYYDLRDQVIYPRLFLIEI